MRRIVTPWAGAAARGLRAATTAHALLRVSVAATLVFFVASCGDDLPSNLGSDQRSAPDELRQVEITIVQVDSVFDDSLQISLGSSPTGQVGSQHLYTTHLLFDFSVPTFVVQDGDTLELDDGRLEIGFVGAEPQPYEGTMQLLLREVSLDGREWRQDSVLAGFPDLQPGPALAQLEVPSSAFDAAAFELQMALDPKALVGFDSVLARREPLDVNVACKFDTFTVDGPGFIEFPYRASSTSSNVRFVGNYRTPENTGIERSSSPQQRMAVVEFDPSYSPGTNLVASDGHRWHTYLRFVDVDSVLPPTAFVHAAELILVQADRGDSIFGTGPDLGIMVPPDTTSIYTMETNERSLGFRTPVVAVPNLQVTMVVTAYLFDQQEGTVANHGMLLRLSNEGTKARHFEFFGPTEADSLRPRLRIVYGLPADFGGGGSP